MSRPNMKPLVKELREILDDLDESLLESFQNMHGGYPEATLERFLRARDADVTKASKMLVDCLNWRVNNNIDDVLAVIYLSEHSCLTLISVQHFDNSPNVIR
ncbi:hypothetical protein M758_7G144400 [Ceratodon purpureus]|nr:hypothetical protein M758_7G144400 [Ceratodon purpureus]